MSAPVSCPAAFVAAPASGQGKTTLTAAMARYHRNQGLRVRVFKTGPDFLDPMILEQASGHPVDPLHLWMVGATACRQKLFEAAQDADLILVEGSMGLFDGDPSGADLDAAFACIYPGNLDLLRAMGAELEFFAPIEGDPLPAVDAVWLPGGYAELHLKSLMANKRLKGAALPRAQQIGPKSDRLLGAGDRPAAVRRRRTPEVLVQGLAGDVAGLEAG